MHACLHVGCRMRIGAVPSAGGCARRGTCALKRVQRPGRPESFPPLSNPLPWTSGAITSSSSRTVPNRPPPVPSESSAWI